MYTRVIRRSKTQAFTLIELLLVLVILAVLTTVVATKFTGRTEQARETAASADISSIGLALDAFEIDNGRFPTTEEGLTPLLRQPADAPKWRGPYLKKGAVPRDPWGNAYVYRFPGTRNLNGYDLSSLGPDGRESDDDITNWSAE